MGYRMMVDLLGASYSADPRRIVGFISSTLPGVGLVRENTPITEDDVTEETKLLALFRVYQSPAKPEYAGYLGDKYGSVVAATKHSYSLSSELAEVFAELPENDMFKPSAGWAAVLRAAAEDVREKAKKHGISDWAASVLEEAANAAESGADLSKVGHHTFAALFPYHLYRMLVDSGAKGLMVTMLVYDPDGDGLLVAPFGFQQNGVENMTGIAVLGVYAVPSLQEIDSELVAKLGIPEERFSPVVVDQSFDEMYTVQGNVYTVVRSPDVMNEPPFNCLMMTYYDELPELETYDPEVKFDLPVNRPEKKYVYFNTLMQDIEPAWDSAALRESVAQRLVSKDTLEVYFPPA